jgi:DME family drug/metabolite transporter
VPRRSIATVDPRLLVVAAAMLWGTTGTARALGPDDAAPAAVGAARMVVGGGALALIGWHQGWIGRPGRTGRADRWRSPEEASPWAGRIALGLAAAGMAAYQPLFFGGVARAGVAVGTMVGIGSAPVFAGMLGLLVRGERPGRRWGGATALALAGTLLLVGAGDSDDVDVLGLVMALGAGASYAVYVAASKDLLDRGRRPEAVVSQALGLAAVLMVPVAVTAGIGPLVSAGGVAMVLHLGLVTMVVGYLLFGRGLAGVGVAVAGTLTLAEPATATTLGIVVLGERPGTVTIVGLALVAAGLVVLALPDRRARRVTVT